MSARTARAVFLDRDGVLNEPVIQDGKPHAPRSVAEVALIPGVAEACARLKAAGYVLVLVTNQPEIARGTLDAAVVHAINEALAERLGIDGVYMCPHDDADGCSCRKPNPGMLLTASAERNIDLARSFMVGDRWRDTQAGDHAGCTTVFVDRRYSERRPEHFDVAVRDLTEAADWILANAGVRPETANP